MPLELELTVTFENVGASREGDRQRPVLLLQNPGFEMVLLPLFIAGVLCFLLTGLVLKVYIALLGNRTPPTLQSTGNGKRITVGFFHPYCNAGGGGERVLWCAVRALQKRYPKIDCVVYTGDVDAKAEEIVQRARNRFNIVLPRAVDFVFLHKRNFVEAKLYPVLTLLGQSLGSVILGWEALSKFVPDIYVDSMGYAFTLPLFKYVGGCRVACYTHYPTISTDMLARVTDRTVAYNNQGLVARNTVLSRVKVIYYKMFARLYSLVGARADIVMVNSSWTYGHINYLWGIPSCTSIVYPPCDTEEFLSIKSTPDNERPVKSIVSIAQFRPEKDHKLQLRAFSAFLKRLSEEDRERVKLELIGSCRNAEDQQRVEELRAICADLAIQDRTEFMLSVPFDVLKDRLAQGTMGLHTMWNEHFGIGVVECMAAGTIIIAHDSGGPRMDIVTPYEGQVTGFLASDEEGYADAMEKVFRMTGDERRVIRDAARASVGRFSDQEFEDAFLRAVEPLFV